MRVDERHFISRGRDRSVRLVNHAKCDLPGERGMASTVIFDVNALYANPDHDSPTALDHQVRPAVSRRETSAARRRHHLTSRGWRTAAGRTP